MKIKDFKLERFYAKYEFSTPYMLSSSDAESFSIKELLSLEESAIDEFFNLKLGYTESQGDPELREQISSLYSSINKENVIVFVGAEEGIFIFINTLLNKGDHVIVQYPAYQSLYEVCYANDIQVSLWEMRGKKGWSLDLDLLQTLIQKNTKAIIINSPHNPTGYLISQEEQDKIIEYCKKNNLILFSDEVYRFSEYKEEDRLKPICDIYDKGLSLGVLSKPFGLPGLRIGWIVTKNKEFFDKIKSFKDYTTICNSAPSEFLAKIAIKHRNSIIGRNMSLILNNLALLNSFLNKYQELFEWVEPKAGNIGFIKIKFSDNVETFTDDLIKKKGVLLLPSTVYGYGTKYFRIGFGRKDFNKAMTLLEEYVEENIV
ncbi:MAG: aminotransferase class I/II-fold pyridoxal phosphate-dependent enzyme [Candidatus Hodarchaeales archaeon]|jgi:aspartate/methionine/tyrosine aminotransferase